MGEVAAKVRAFIENEVANRGMDIPSDDTPLLVDILDSINILSLLTFIEAEFQVVLDPDEIEKSLANINSIEREINRLRSVGTVPGQG